MSGRETLQFNQLKKRELLLKKLRQRVGEVGLTLTIAEELEKANVHIALKGDTFAWETPGQPVIAVGDHSKGLECLHFLGACGMVGRSDVSIMAKPYALTGQIADALAQDEDTVLGLVPGNMARGRKGGDMATRINRYLFRKQLPEKEQIKEYNRQSMDKAAELLEDDGRLITIFPTGGVHDATTPWRSGVGQLAARLSPETLDETLVVPFGVEGLRPTRVMRAILLSRFGLTPKRQDITLTFGQQESLGAIFDSENMPTPEVITEVLQQRYQAEFPPETLPNAVPLVS